MPSPDNYQHNTSCEEFKAFADGLVQRSISDRELFRIEKYREVWHVRRVKSVGRQSAPEAHSRPRRGEVVRFSRKSRKRLLEALAEAQATPTHFITLTYPREWPESPTEWKRHLANFFKRVARQWPSYGAVWRLEFQRRGAPHFHALIYNLTGISPMEFRLWVRQAWYEVVNSGDERHLYAGTQADEVKSHAHAARYVSKYAAKVSDDECLPDTDGESIGRFWGVRGELRRDVIEVVTICREDLVELKRTVRKWLRSRGARRYAKQIARMPVLYGFSVLGLTVDFRGG